MTWWSSLAIVNCTTSYCFFQLFFLRFATNFDDLVRSTIQPWKNQRKIELSTKWHMWCSKIVSALRFFQTETIFKNFPTPWILVNKDQTKVYFHMEKITKMGDVKSVLFFYSPKITMIIMTWIGWFFSDWFFWHYRLASWLQREQIF